VIGRLTDTYCTGFEVLTAVEMTVTRFSLEDGSSMSAATNKPTVVTTKMAVLHSLKEPNENGFLSHSCKIFFLLYDMFRD
jgi:hypothetical protein